MLLHSVRSEQLATLAERVSAADEATPELLSGAAIADWRYLQNRLAPLTAALSKESPAALKYALCLLGLLRPNTRLPIVALNDSAKAEVASVIAELAEEDLAGSGWRGPRYNNGLSITN